MAAARRPAAGVDLAVIEAGTGGRPLLLVHGFTGAKEDFGDWIDAFADDGWWVVAPDLRGHGESDQPEAEDAYSLAQLADDLEALVADLGWASFALVGHSMGGMVAQELVLRPGSVVERLVLMDTCHGPVEGVEPETAAVAVEIIRTQGLPALVELLSQLPSQPRAASDEALRAARPGYAEFADAKVHRCAGAMYAAMGTELCARVDRLEELRSLELPTRVVVGAEDRAFLGPSRRMAEAIPGADLVVVPDAAHSPQFENPTAWWDAVAPFLAGRGG